VLVRGRARRDMPHRVDRGQHPQGTLDELRERGGVAIGARLAESLSLRSATPHPRSRRAGAAPPSARRPRIKGYPVAAVFEIGMSEFDATFVYMPLKEAQAYFNREGDVTSSRCSSTTPTGSTRPRRPSSRRPSGPIV
jgi:lipoprotein-releasing system permease protein